MEREIIPAYEDQLLPPSHEGEIPSIIENTLKLLGSCSIKEDYQTFYAMGWFQNNIDNEIVALIYWCEKTAINIYNLLIYDIHDELIYDLVVNRYMNNWIFLFIYRDEYPREDHKMIMNLCIKTNITQWQTAWNVYMLNDLTETQLEDLLSKIDDKQLDLINKYNIGPEEFKFVPIIPIKLFSEILSFIRGVEKEVEWREDVIMGAIKLFNKDYNRHMLRRTRYYTDNMEFVKDTFKTLLTKSKHCA